MSARKRFGVKHKYIEIYYSQLPERIESKRLQQLVQKLRAGDTEVKEEIVLGHLRLGLYIASQYDTIFNRGNDLFSEAQLAIVEAVGMAQKALYDDNITPYIEAKIHQHISDYISRDVTIYVPGRTIRRWAELFDARIKSLPTKVGTLNSEQVNVFIVTPFIIDDTSELEIMDILEHCTFSFIEKKIVELRREGYNLEEIAPIIGYSKSMIGKILNEVEERFNQEYKILYRK